MVSGYEQFRLKWMDLLQRLESGKGIPEELDEASRRDPVIVLENMGEKRLGSCLALDAGCGTGLGSYALAKGGGKVVMVDILPEALKCAKLVHEGFPSDGVMGDLYHLPFKAGVFDIIYSGGVLEHFREVSAPLGEVRRVLKPSGRFFPSVPNLFSFYAVRYRLMAFKRFINWLAGKGEEQYERLYTVNAYLKALRRGGFRVLKLVPYWVAYMGTPHPLFRWRKLRAVIDKMSGHGLVVGFFAFMAVCEKGGEKS